MAEYVPVKMTVISDLIIINYKVFFYENNFHFVSSTEEVQSWTRFVFLKKDENSYAIQTSKIKHNLFNMYIYCN